jgi:tRNA G10  N-methylase Trm11
LVKAHYYFKLDPNIRNPTEALLGRMEIETLARRKVEPIRHFYDVVKHPPISYFDDESVRIQDFLLNLRTAYGNIQGYYFSDELSDISRFVERLGYTREIYVCSQMPSDAQTNIENLVFPHGVKGKNLQIWTSRSNGQNHCLFRVITNMFFLEQINNVTLCSAGSTRERQIERINDNLNRLANHIMENIRNYIPKFPRDSNWKEFEDFVDEPNEITLYLTQFYGPPYKAKFHPRMIRALLNFADACQPRVTGDFMLGSGTLAIESVLLNVTTKGSDVNPLAEIVTNAKIDALSFEPHELLKEIDSMVAALPRADEIHQRDLEPFAVSFFQGKEKMIDQALFLNDYIRTKMKERYRDFFLCALAKVSSSAYKMKNEPDLFSLFCRELWTMWKVVYCFKEIRSFLHVPIAEAKIRTDDVRALKSVENETIDLIITSPPYSTAIDYVRMDLSQLLALGLIDNPKELDEKMMGTRRKTSDINDLAMHISHSQPILPDENNRFHRLPAEAQKYILDLKDDNNMKNALRCYRFLHNMWDALKQMHRVLKDGGRCIIIIGNNNFAVQGEDREFRNGDFLEEMALKPDVGFRKWRQKIIREYSKSSYGTILKEDVIFLEKSSRTQTPI